MSGFHQFCWRSARLRCWTAPLAPAIALVVVLVVLVQPSPAQVVRNRNGRQMVEIDEAALVRLVFSNSQDLQQVDQKLRNVLDLHLEAIEQRIELTPVQQNKLKAAGEADSHRLMTEFEVLQEVHVQDLLTMEEWSELHRTLQPLRLKAAGGLCGSGSLFAKTLTAVLTPEQLTMYREWQSERENLAYHAAVKIFLTMLDSRMPLTREQREKLDELLVKHKRGKYVAEAIVQQGYLQLYFCLFQLSQIPEEELKQLFHDEEWKVMERLRNRGVQMKPTLQRQGVWIDQ